MSFYRYITRYNRQRSYYSLIISCVIDNINATDSSYIIQNNSIAIDANFKCWKWNKFASETNNQDKYYDHAGWVASTPISIALDIRCIQHGGTCTMLIVPLKPELSLSVSKAISHRFACLTYPWHQYEGHPSTFNSGVLSTRYTIYNNVVLQIHHQVQPPKIILQSHQQLCHRQHQRHREFIHHLKQLDFHRLKLQVLRHLTVKQVCHRRKLHLAVKQKRHWNKLPGQLLRPWWVSLNSP